MLCAYVVKKEFKLVEEQDGASVIKLSNDLIMEIKRIIEKYSLEEVKKALDVAESYI